MSNVIFKQGLKADLPLNAPEGTLLFTTDTGELYAGKGSSTPLLPYGSVLYNYTNLADLETKNPAIEGKVYLTADGKIYTYSVANTKYESVGSDSNSIGFDKDGTTLEAESVQAAIVELSTRIDVAEIAITQLDSAVAGLVANRGKIKLTDTDTLDYIDTKLGASLVVEDGVLKVKGIDGVNLTNEQIEALLNGATGNIQGQLNTITEEIEGLVSGLTYVGTVTGEADLATITNPANGALAVVTNEGEANELYVYNANASTPAWQKLGKFEFAENFIGLKDTPTSYADSTGKVLKSNGTGLEFSEVTYDSITGKPNVSVADIEDAVAKKHEHANATLLDALGEDVDGNLTYKGNNLSPQWGSFEL